MKNEIYIGGFQDSIIYNWMCTTQICRCKSLISNGNMFCRFVSHVLTHCQDSSPLTWYGIIPTLPNFLPRLILWMAGSPKSRSRPCCRMRCCMRWLLLAHIRLDVSETYPKRNCFNLLYTAGLVWFRNFVSTSCTLTVCSVYAWGLGPWSYSLFLGAYLISERMGPPPCLIHC